MRINSTVPCIGFCLNIAFIFAMVVPKSANLGIEKTPPGSVQAGTTFR